MLDDELAELKARLDHVEGGLRYISNGAYTMWAEARGQTAGGAMPPDVVALARAGDTMKAVKRYRELTGCGLAEATQAIKTIT